MQKGAECSFVQSAQKKRRFETIYFSKACCVLLYSQYENLDILMWGKRIAA